MTSASLRLVCAVVAGCLSQASLRIRVLAVNTADFRPGSEQDGCFSKVDVPIRTIAHVLQVGLLPCMLAFSCPLRVTLSLAQLAALAGVVLFLIPQLDPDLDLITRLAGGFRTLIAACRGFIMPKLLGAGCLLALSWVWSPLWQGLVDRNKVLHCLDLFIFDSSSARFYS